MSALARYWHSIEKKTNKNNKHRQANNWYPLGEVAWMWNMNKVDLKKKKLLVFSYHS
jgi:hypothetical protein